jgi:DNA polymerase I-like protein with 3'-5' exonuclease and polymerase domains
MQNVPREAEARDLYQAPQGWVFVHGDLSKIEPRAQAQFSKCPVRLELLNRPSDDSRGDIYAVLGSKITATPVAEILRTKGHPAYKLGKTVDLAFCYGMREVEFQARTKKADGTRYTLEEAIAFRQTFFDTFPGMRDWIEQAWDNTRLGAVTEGRTPLGRRRIVLPHISGMRNTRAWREFQAQVNFKVQGACADGLKLGIIRISRRLPTGAVIVLSVHDELLILCRPADAQAIAEMANKEISEAYRIALGGELLVPIIFGAKPIKTWAEK